ncbi:Tetraspanin/Peripherin [Trinorchestia longiramus]|nr:Tetraspanin/Peripherin [Trinorchestia longiramus]
MQIRGDYVAFGALLFITATGLALVTVGSCLLGWSAYLSPWLPSWIWMSIAGFTVLGVAIAASSTVCAIATIAPKPKAAHKCLVLLLMLLAVELISSAMVAVRQPVWYRKMYYEVQDIMQSSFDVYSTNSSAAAMWDEIQNEISCCGVLEYADWFTSPFGDGASVPDSCCLLPAPGCGLDIKTYQNLDDYITTEVSNLDEYITTKVSNLGDYITTEVSNLDDYITTEVSNLDDYYITTKGCLPVLSSGWSKSYIMLSRQAILPICVVQVLMVCVIVLTLRSMGRLAGDLPVVVRNPMSNKPQQYSLMA